MNKLTLFLLTILLSATSLYAQKSDNKLPQVQFGDLVTSKDHAATQDQLLSNQRLTCKGENCTITKYEVSLLALHADNGKDAYYGPYTITGNELNAKVKELVKKYTGFKTRIFFEKVQATCGGKNVILPGVTVYAD